MSRLFGIVCNEPARLAQAIDPVRDALTVDEAPHGWGLASFQGGEVLLQRSPKPSAPVDFAKALQDLRSDYVIGNVRAPGAKTAPENTPPYRYRSWVFGHSGRIQNFAAMQSELLSSVPDFLRRSIRGQTESESLFHLLLAFLHDAGKLDEPEPRVADAEAALRATLAMAEKLATQHGAAVHGLNCMLTNGRFLLAARKGPPMYWKRLHTDVPVKEPRNGPGSLERHVIILSEPKGGKPDGFEEIPDGQIATVSRDFHTSVAPIATATPPATES
jgi:predicted glutamine amidotransferase